MPRERPSPPPFEPEALERSLDRYLTVGLVFMALLIAGFITYKVREPGLRRDATAQQAASYRQIGRQLFANNCASCHGKDANGGSAPVLNSKEFLKSATDGQIERIVGGGVSGTEMPAWALDFGGTLTDEQIQQLTTYLRSLESGAPSVPTWRSGATAAAAAAAATTTTTPPVSGTTVQVQLSDTSGLNGSMSITSSPTSVPAGDVTFVVKNNGTIDHEMVVLKTDTPYDQMPVTSAGDPPAKVTSGGDKVDESTSVGETGDPNLKPGETRSFTVKDMTAGNYILVCNIAKHYQMGMRAPFKVS
jgi:mono/diheme cytochrome c family protein